MLHHQAVLLSALAAAAAATTTLRVGFTTFANDFRHPAVLAKEAATLDLLSDGRLELGIGAGWAKGQYEMSGIAFDPPGTRVARLAEAVHVIQKLWSGEAAVFDGRYYRLSGLWNSNRSQAVRLQRLLASIHRLVRAVRQRVAVVLPVSTDSMAGMEAFDPHVEAARLAAASFRQLALRATSEVQAALTALASMTLFAPEPLFGSESNAWELLRDGQRCAAEVAAFVDQALGALDPYCAVSFPPQRRRLVRYDVPDRAALAMEGGCTKAGWHARVEAQRLAGVRSLYMAIGCALVEDLDRLTDLGPVLDEQLPKAGPARQQLDAFQVGIGRLVGLIELLADARRVVYYTAPDGRRLVDLFRSAEAF